MKKWAQNYMERHDINKNMGQYATVPITRQQYTEIIETMRTGASKRFRPNPQIAEILIAEANLGIRIEDILSLKPSCFIASGNIHKINIIEKKTKKKRYKTVSEGYYSHLKKYITENNIKNDELIFKISERAVQKYLHKVCEYLGYENVSTHSFRKYCGMCLYEANGYNIVLVMEFFQHSSPDITKRYLGVDAREMEAALQNHVELV